MPDTSQQNPSPHDHADAPPLSASRRSVVKTAIAGAAGLAGGTIAAFQHPGAAQDQATPAAGDGALPNILAIMADDIGYWNISAYSLGMMGFQTPNIDRIAREGIQFTDAYGEQSCTAGRAAFITGQSPFRTGLLSIGMPGEDQGLDAADPTIAELLKPLGYATGQFGKNHLGDLNKHLPTVHGFDEFFGNLYHLNAHEEPENEDYPTDPAFFEKYGPRGVLHCWASDVDDPTEDPRFGRVGKQVIEDTGALDTTRMETIDDEFMAGALDFLDRAQDANQPFFLWYNPSRMHIFTHLKPESVGVTGLGIEADGMVEHDGQVGQLLQKLDDLGVADNTIVLYLTDNGTQVFSWPDGGMAPFKGEKNSNWEGAYRVPMMARWPGRIAPGTISNDVFSLQDWLPTLLAAAGVPDVKEQLRDGYQAGDATYSVYVDGYNQVDHLTAGAPSERHEFYYFNDDGQIAGLRQDRWKFVMLEQPAEGLDVWFEPLDELRRPRVVDLRGDPFERALAESANYDTWLLERLFLLYPLRDQLDAFYQTFLQFPPRQSAEIVGKVTQLIDYMEQLAP